MAGDREALLLQISADVRGLEKAFARASGIVNKESTFMERRAAQMAAKMERAGKVNVGAALDRVFDSSRLKVLDSGIARIGLFGSALEPLGPLGLAAAAGVGAMALAVNRAIGDMNWGDALQTSADKLRITAEALQELRFMADETDVPVEELEAALMKLNGAIGAIKTGVGDAKLKPVFKALGLERADLANVNDAMDLLPLLADRLGQVSSTAEQVQLARKLGVESLLPLLRRGSAGLKEMADRARELGIVLSNDMVKGLADADREMELAGQQIQSSLRAGFAGMAVDIAHATTMLAAFLLKLRELGEANPILGYALERAKRFVLLGPLGSNFAIGAGRKTAPGPSGADIGRYFNVGEPPAFDPADASKGGGKGKSAADEARRRAERAAAAEKELQRLEMEVLDTARHASVAADEKLTIALARLELEGQAAEEEVRQAEIRYRETKGLEGLSAAEAAARREKQAEVQAQKERNLTLDHLQDAAERQLRHEQALAAYAVEALGLQADMGGTLAERYQVQRELLALERAAARQALAEALRKDPNVTQAQAAAQLAGFDRVTDAQGRALEHDVREQYKQGILGALQAVRGGMASLAQHFADSMADKLMNRLADLGADFMMNLLTGRGGGSGGGGGLLSAGARLLGIPGFAAGTSSAPGGLAYVHKDELVNLPRGSQVFPKGALRGLASAAAPAVHQSIAQTTIVEHHHHNDFRGAVMTEELVRSFKRYADDGDRSVHARALRDAPAAVARFRRERG